MGAILASGTEPGGLGARWGAWLVPGAVAWAVGILAFRFPRTAGLPLLVLAGAGLWWTADALKDFHALGAGGPVPQVQPLTDREVVTAFVLRVDRIDLPDALPVAEKTLFRIRAGAAADPPEPWWPWLAARGWARSSGAPLPPSPLKYGVYRLSLSSGEPRWLLVLPELRVPGAP